MQDNVTSHNKIYLSCNKIAALPGVSNKVGLIRVRHENYFLYHILNMAGTDTF